MANYRQQPEIKPDISVIIHAFNHGKFIAECIDSIIAQTLQPSEIVICDDHSQDRTWEIIESYHKSNPGLIRTYRHEKNIGMHYNATFALRQVKGALISSLDGDDCWLREKLEKEWQALQRMPEAKIAYSNVITIDAHGNITGIWYNGKGPQPPSGDVFAQVFAKRFFPNNTSVFRNQLTYRSAMDVTGHQDHNIPVHIDWDLKIRLTSKFKVAYSGEALVKYRMHDAGIHVTQRHRLAESERAVINKNLYLLDSRTPEEIKFIKEGISDLLKTHSPEIKNKAEEHRGENLIFLISLPRSGSTLLQRILGSNPEIHTVSEPWIMLHPLYALKKEGIQAEYEWNLGRNALDDFLAQTREGEELYIKSVRAMANVLYDGIRQSSQKTFFLDKTPRYYFILSELYRVYPKAQYVFLLRNPLAVLASVLNSWFGHDFQLLKSNHNWSDLTRGPVSLLNGIRQLKEKAIIVHYEELVDQPQLVVNQVCNRLGVAFDPAMIQYGKSSHLQGRYGDQLNVNRNEKPVKDYAGKWIEYLTRDEKLYTAALEYLNLLGKPLLAELGYSFTEISDRLKESFSMKGKTVIPVHDYLDDVRSLREAGQTEKAALLIEKLLKKNADDVRLLNMKGELLLEDGHTEAAKIVFESNLQKWPENIDALNDLAVVQIMQNDYAAALQNLKTVLRLDSANEVALQNFAFLRSKLEAGETKQETINWPKISVITPSFNQGKYIEQTIQSVLEQNYPNFEHIIMDGGSGDKSVEILKNYPHLIWKSEKDKGQADAVNKALKIADGEIIAWINSDDWYAAEAFFRIAKFFLENPEKNIVMGDCHLVNEQNQIFDTVVNHERGFDELKKYWVGRSIPTQPAIFFRKSLIDQFGYLDETLFFAMDYDLWLRFALENRFYHLNKIVAYYRFHSQAKGGNQNWSKFIPEWKRISEKYQSQREQRPLISVIIPCYNYGRYLQETVESVIDQTFQNIEIIIVNDGSTDNTREVAEAMIAQHPENRIKLINQTNSGQPAISRNNGIAAAQGQYILPLDGDDKLAPQMLERCLDLLQSNPQIAIAYTDRQDFDGVDQVVAAGDFDFSKLKYGNQISHCALYYKEMWRKIGGYRTNVRGLEDWDFWIAAGVLGFKGQRISEPLFLYRRHDTGVFQHAKQNFEERFAQIILNNRAAYSGKEVGQAQRYLEMKLKAQNSDKPLFSVIVPTFNRPQMLEDALRSILKQTVSDLEIIVVNDAGQPVNEIIEKLNSAKNIKYIEHRQNKGLAASRNTGIKTAQGKYIALLDDDDLFYENHLHTALSYLNNGAKVVYTDAVRATFARKNGQYELQERSVPYSIDFDRQKLLIGNISPVNCFVFERELALRAGLFDESLSTLEDWDFWIRLSKLTDFRHVAQATVQVNWRSDGTTMTSSRHAEFKKNRERIYQKNMAEIKKIADVQQILDEFNRIWSNDGRAASANPNLSAGPDAEIPLVSIVMLTWNALEFTQKCLRSIAGHTTLSYEIIFVDNGSTDGTKEYLSEISKQKQNFKTIFNEKNLGFAAGNNQGVHIAGGKYVLLLNNDVLVADGWLENLVQALESDERIGLVGPITNQISGLQMVSGIPYSDESAFPEFARRVRSLNRGKITPRRRIAGFAMLLRKSLYEELGGLDESFGSGNFEDDDFCLRLRENGYAIMVDESVFIHHFGSQTFIANALDYQASLQEKGQRFRQKWPLIDYEELLEMKNPLAEFLPKTLQQASKILGAGDADQAQILYQQVFRNNPLSPEALLGLILCARQLKDFAGALNYLHTLIKRDPSQAEAFNQLGLVLMATGDLRHAADAFQTALALDNTYLEAKRNHADVFFQTGEAEQGKELLLQILNDYPDDVPALLYLSYHCWENGSADEADAYLNRVFMIEPENPTGLQLKELLAVES